MVQARQSLDSLLNRSNNFPMVTNPLGPIPLTNIYQPLRELATNGFSFTTRDLLHAIGCKMVNLPSSDEDEAIKCAYMFLRVLDLESPILCFKNIGYASDFQTVYSEAVGVGMTCLIASRCFNIPWDILEPIPGPGRRFDYLGILGNRRYLFESKGTKYRSNQQAQIIDGLDKKKYVREKGEPFDVGLITSTCIGENPEQPRIMMADPIFNVNLSDIRHEFYRYRHFARVSQFIGDTRLGRRLYVESNSFAGKAISIPRRNVSENQMSNLDSIRINGETYVGHWYDSWQSKNSRRYGNINKADLPNVFRDQPQSRIFVFQGLLEKNYNSLLKRDLEGIKGEKLEKEGLSKKFEDNLTASVFSDGSILIVREDK